MEPCVLDLTQPLHEFTAAMISWLGLDLIDLAYQYSTMNGGNEVPSLPKAVNVWLERESHFFQYNHW